MKFALLGWSFKKTSIETRERLALPYAQQLLLARQIFPATALQELFILSTCNRIEFLFVAEHPQAMMGELQKHLSDHFHLPQLAETAYTLYDLAAVAHLFRVTASLDSMIVGEPQIQGQVKEAYQHFFDNDYVGSFFKGLFPRAFFAAKRVRTETQIAHNAVSISFAAVELAKRIFNELAQQTVMIIGAGEMAELAAKHFLKNGVSKLLITNRTFAHAVALAEKYQGSALRFEQLADYLETADIVISSTGAKDFVLSPNLVKHCLKRRKGNPMFFIDIAVPRDIDPTINDLPGVYAYDIDDLQTVVAGNREERKHQAHLAEQIIAEEVEKLQSWFKNLSVVPTIRCLREQFQTMGAMELEKTLEKLHGLTPEQKQQVARLVHTLTNKLLHTPTHNLRKFGNQEDGHLYLDSLHRLFELSPVELSSEAAEPRPLKLVKPRASR